MKHAKRIMAVVVAVMMLLLMMPTAFAANNVEAGETATVNAKFSNVVNVDGTFSLSDPDGIVDGGITIKAGNTGSLVGAVKNDKIFYYAADGTTASSVTIKITVPVKASAQPGDTCKINFKGITDEDVPTSKSWTVTVVEKQAEGEDPKDPVDPDEPTEPDEPTKPSKPSTPSKPGDSGVSEDVDYTELEKQIAIANGLNESEYTAASWAALAEALENAKAALSSSKQETVDAAAQALKDAIAALVKMDYSKLEAAMNDANAYINSLSVGDIWRQLLEAMAKGAELMQSGDQEAVNAIADEINELLAKLKAEMEALKTVETVTEEVIVEVPVEGEDCHIQMHKVWPIIAIISIALNVVAVIVIILLLSKKKNRKDNTPLVKYDIDAD